jgi:rhodanese-related sulfurtransferase
MASNFGEAVENARAGIALLSPAEVQQAIQADPRTLILDVRDDGDLNITGVIEGSENVSMGTLYFRADHNLPRSYHAACLTDKDRPIITTCTLGMVACIAARTLKDYGFTDVKILEGGNSAWKEAGLPLLDASTIRAVD